MSVGLSLATTKTSMVDRGVEATFIDVGHGTSVILRFAEDDVWLYDCGRLGNDRGSSRDIDVSLWSLGVTQLRGVFLSHADADHFNALPGVLKRFDVQQIITPPGMLEEPEPALDAVRRAVHRSGISVREISGNRILTQSGHLVRVLHPPPQRLVGGDNANSLVLRIDCGGKSLILPGDLEPPGTDRLVGQPRPPPGGVLMAPHHGSLTLDASSVLQWSRPRETIVSGGQRARRAEVHEMLAVTGSGVHVTSMVGAVRATIDPAGGIEIRGWAQSPW
jgi:competence protein ComEC